MENGKQLKYGINQNEDSCVKIPGRMGASEVIAAKSGRFVKWDGSGRLEIAGDGDTALAGFVELGDSQNYNASGIYTCSSTEGKDVVTFIPAQSMQGVVVRLPINTGAPTTVATMRAKYGLSCDLSVASNIQGVQAGVSAEDTVVIVNGDEENFAWVDVMLNPAKIDFTGVA